MSKAKIYISIPIRGMNYELQRERARFIEEYLRGHGFDTVSPFRNGLPREAPRHEHLKKDLQMLDKCDAIYMCDRWGFSDGCLLEFKRAMEKGIKIMYMEGTLR
jgi:hypothetical protein